METDPIKIFMVDDEKVFVEALRAFFDRIENIEVIGTATDPEESIRKIQDKVPDIILMDIHFKEKKLNGIEVMQKLLEINPDLKFIMLTYRDQNSYIDEAMEKGAKGYFLKDGDINELVIELRLINKGSRIFPPIQNDERKVNLSDREKEVASLICEGFTSNDIAEKLHLSINTINSHRKNIFSKCEINNVAGLIKWMIKNGYMDGL